MRGITVYYAYKDDGSLLFKTVNASMILDMVIAYVGDYTGNLHVGSYTLYPLTRWGIRISAN
jgi:hypothetical protein